MILLARFFDEFSQGVSLIVLLLWALPTRGGKLRP